ncbi:NADH:flavin oxidoreductase [Clostridium sp. OS1-26]|uniref:oxidoreductase n=1 Tax=Clostridium sp. OS1-26 TaxID=3070681 RepID=UPI0027E1E643|nr:NADH:flavin oxidoreductase [Clostridium sp. OS1-26]WML37643.1 NADH:flavin oxidoreductase [Clostridium sp. OS1-26]
MEILNPIKVKNIRFKNKVVMAPMVPFGLQSNDGIMEEEMLQHYLKRADTGIGLIISQSLSITARKTLDGRAGAYSDSHIDYLSTIVKACHDNGTNFFAQLAYPSIGYQNGDTINNLTEEDILEIQNEFINAAKTCKKAGCDGIELHGAHGFFLNMLASPLSNKRKDQHGRDINGRLSLVKKIVEGIKEFADDNFIISYRLGWNDCLNTDIKTAQALENLGIEMLHISSGIPSDRNLELPKDFQFNEVIYTGCQIKKNVNIPVTVVNDIRTLNRGNYLIESKLCDFVAYGKPFLADSNFMVKSMKNLDYNSCLGCKKCQWFISGEKCPVQIKTRVY